MQVLVERQKPYEVKASMAPDLGLLALKAAELAGSEGREQPDIIFTDEVDKAALAAADRWTFQFAKAFDASVYLLPHTVTIEDQKARVEGWTRSAAWDFPVRPRGLPTEDQRPWGPEATIVFDYEQQVGEIIFQ